MSEVFVLKNPSTIVVRSVSAKVISILRVMFCSMEQLF